MIDSSPLDPTEIFESFLDPAKRAQATSDLAKQSVAAIPVLLSLFTGEAKNRSGSPYNRLGMPVDCALLVVGNLGRTAKPLEPYVRAALLEGHFYAVTALGRIGRLRKESIKALADCLSSEDANLAIEAAFALKRCKLTDHPLVSEATKKSPRAAWTLAHSAHRCLWNQTDGPDESDSADP